MENEIITCHNCGAEFESNLLRCPYCDAVNEKADAGKYYEKLDEMNSDFKELYEKEIAEKTTENLIHYIKIVALIVIGCSILAIIGGLL